MKIAYLNKKFIPLDKAKVSMLDRGLLYGDGVFETMRAYNGIVFRLEKHLERLFKSLKAFYIQPKPTKLKIRKIVYTLLKKNKLKDAYMKIIVTRGKNHLATASVATWRPTRSPKVALSTVAIYTLPYKPLPRNVYERGIKIGISSSILNEKSKITSHKTLNYLQNVLCRDEARKKGFADVVLINTKGSISEATSSNIFLVKRKRLFTPCLKSGTLPGIIRAEIIRISKNTKEIFIKTKDLYKADEIFLTNSLSEIVPVVKINNRPIGKGKPGPVTKKLMESLKESVYRYCRKENSR